MIVSRSHNEGVTFSRFCASPLLGVAPLASRRQTVGVYLEVVG